MIPIPRERLEFMIKLFNLDPEVYLKFKSIVNGVDQVNEKANQIFFENVLSYVEDDKVFAALGISKPYLYNSRPHILEGNAAEFYKEFAKYFGPVAILSNPEDERVKAFNKKYPTILLKNQQKLDEVSKKYSAQIAKQSIYNYNEAFLKIFPHAHRFLTQSTRFNFQERLKEYLLLDKTKENWVKNVTAETFQVEMSVLKAQCDYIDPTMKLSNKIQPIYMGYFFFKQSKNGSIKLTTDSQKLIDITIKFMFEQGDLASTDSSYKQFISDSRNLVKTLTPTGAQTSGVASQIAVMIRDHIKNAPVAGESNAAMNERFEKALKKRNIKVAQLKFGKTMLNIFFRVAYGYVLFSAAQNVKDNNWVKNVEFFKDIVGFTLDTLASFKMGDEIATKACSELYGKIMKRAAPIFYKACLKNRQLVSKLTGFAKNIFSGSLSKFVTVYLTPVVFIVGACISVYDAVQSANDGNWGAMSMDISSAVVQASGAIAIVFIYYLVGLSWAGLAGLAVGLVVLACMLVKELWFKSSQISALVSYLDSLSN